MQPAISAEALAALLLEEMIDREVIHPRHLDMNAATSEKFRTKAREYQLAAVLLAVLSVEQRRPEFLRARHELEKLVFSAHPTADNLQVVPRVGDAMSDLRALLFPANPRVQLSWARAWLLAIDIEESNPATLALLSMQCMDAYICAVECLSKVSVR